MFVQDIVHELLLHMKPKRAINYLSTCKELYHMPWIIRRQVLYSDVSHHTYRERFVNCRDVNGQNVWPTMQRIEYLNDNINTILPASLTHLTSFIYNQSLNAPWPSHLIHLYLYGFNRPLIHAWPSTLTYLNLYTFDHSLIQAWPNNLKTIKLHRYSHDLMQSWPTSLTCLELSAAERINTQLPSSLKRLTLWQFNSPLLIWPQNLKYVEFIWYNHPIDQWPEHLIEINLSHFNQSLSCEWPSQLKRLRLVNFNHLLTQAWPVTMKYIDMHAYSYSLPSLSHCTSLKWCRTKTSHFTFDKN